ncbi:MAG: hypothetical protein IJ997_00205 [Mycoplasmataceae bacterium]|nr:hypothetical protein [Mycoplasmataceae bacterium]
MNQLILGNKYNYSNIIDGKEIYTLTTVNNSKQTINGDVLSAKGFTATMTYVPEDKWYHHELKLNLDLNNYTIYYVIVDIEIVKPENTNISFYQLNNRLSINDDTVAFPSNNGLVDTFNWIYMTSTEIVNGMSFRFQLQSFDQSENLLDISNLTVNISVKCHPII